MSDPREAIFARLEQTLSAIAGVDEVERGQPMGDDDESRATRIVLLEGDELPDEDDLARSRNQPPNAARVIHMLPQLTLVNFAVSSDVGPNLSTIRKAVIDAIATDATLTALTHKNAGGRYLGFESDMGFGRLMAGQMTLKYQFTYLLYPGQA